MRLLILTSLLLAASLAGAHGEDTPGPHHGLIRMPGNYHTELVPEAKNSFRVYLLDMEWKNPSIQDSAVWIQHKSKKVTPGDCKAKDNYYVCSLPARINLDKKGELLLKSKRDGQTGAAVSYALPLKTE